MLVCQIAGLPSGINLSYRTSNGKIEAEKRDNTIELTDIRNTEEWMRKLFPNVRKDWKIKKRSKRDIFLIAFCSDRIRLVKCLSRSVD